MPSRSDWPASSIVATWGWGIRAVSPTVIESPNTNKHMSLAIYPPRGVDLLIGRRTGQCLANQLLFRRFQAANFSARQDGRFICRCETGLHVPLDVLPQIANDVHKRMTLLTALLHTIYCSVGKRVGCGMLELRWKVRIDQPITEHGAVISYALAVIIFTSGF